jgi:excinuclease UvrABC ATPase subunit
MQQGQIRVVGARQHNLKDVSLTVPRRAITAFTGVSGSGKTSLAFDTIAAEAQRQLTRRSPRSCATGCRATAGPMST